MVCYMIACLDRVNVGFAKLQMEADPRFSEKVYGFGAGIFFIGYFLFEIPRNLIVYRAGALMDCANYGYVGLISASFVLVKTPIWFYTLRFFLGAAETGFFPGILLYLTY
jgi:hypothetical protein